MTASRLCQRTLSAFEPSTRRWAPVPTRSASSQAMQQFALTSDLVLTTWNIDAFSSRPIARAKHILGSILEDAKRSDIVFLQEVTSEVRSSILDDANVREAFLVTDADDQTSFEGVPFATMTLLSRKRFAFDLESKQEEDGVERAPKFMLGPVTRVKFPSKYGRCVLSVDIISPSTPSTPGTVCRIINVHLDSLGDTLPYRTEQMSIVANLLREPECGGGLVAGDFNAISPEDHTLLDKNGLVDAWLALHEKEELDGATWGVGVELPGGLRPGRLDKVAMLGVEAKEMEILRPGLIEVPKPGGDSCFMPCSDHFGLRLRFTV